MNASQPRHPKFLETLLADAAVAAASRGERHEFRSRRDGIIQALRLMVQTDAFLALAAYRAKSYLRARGIPVLPWIAHRVAIASANVSIDDRAYLHPGVAIPNGQVVIQGEVEIRAFATLQPWVIIGPIAGETAGPDIGMAAVIGSGAKVLGDIEIGANARVGSNAVVLDDVPANTTVVGLPAQAIAD